jgi:FKBP-type peptidyl-prolyl cis-trans isomerase
MCKSKTVLMKIVNIKTIIISFAVVSIMFSLISCNHSAEYRKQEAEYIQSYLDNNPNMHFELKPSGMYYLVEKEGTGPTPAQHDTVYVKYTGMFLDGTVFETNVGKTDTLIFRVDKDNPDMLKGFDEAVTYIHKGGKSLFILPSSLAFGSWGYSSYYVYIPGYTPLLYEYELVKIKSGAGK